jgi:putative transposase
VEVDFCLEALRGALRWGRLEIFNSDQVSQFTRETFTGELEAQGIVISMDGRGRCVDNIFIERLWRTLKYEEVYLKGYQAVREARESMARYFESLQRAAFTSRVNSSMILSPGRFGWNGR